MGRKKRFERGSLSATKRYAPRIGEEKTSSLPVPTKNSANGCQNFSSRQGRRKDMITRRAHFIRCSVAYRECPVDFSKRKIGPLRNVIDNRCRQLHAKGVGTNKQRTATMADEEEEILCPKGVLGSHNPLALPCAVFYLNGKNFCLRGGDEQRSLRREQLIRKPPDCEMVAVSYTYVESGSKNNPEGISHLKVANKRVTQYSVPEAGERCHCHILDENLSRLPPDCRSDSFYF